MQIAFCPSAICLKIRILLTSEQSSAPRGYPPPSRILPATAPSRLNPFKIKFDKDGIGKFEKFIPRWCVVGTKC